VSNLNDFVQLVEMLDMYAELLSSVGDVPFLRRVETVELTQAPTNSRSAAMASSAKSIEVLYLSY
jgi:hypothetical protein